MPMLFIEKTKKYISNPNHRINLYDLVVERTKELITLTNEIILPVQGTYSLDEFSNRLDIYNKASKELIDIHTLLGYWSTDQQREILSVSARALSSKIQSSNGVVAWLGLRWYPILVLLYATGISSLASSNYKNIHSLFRISTKSFQYDVELPLLLAVVSETKDLEKYFSQLPNRERQYYPKSEYLYEKIQPIITDLLYIADEYDVLFDRFEILLALEHFHLRKKYGFSGWGPIGRFGWKHHSGHQSPFVKFIKNAELLHTDWEPLKSGFFDGSFERFKEISTEFSERLSRL